MKSLLLLSAFVTISVVLVAQNDSIRYMHGLPVGETDTAENNVPADRFPSDNFTPVNPENLPRRLLSQLERKSIYAGWRQFPVYFDENTKLYIIRIKRGDAVKIFGLNEEGMSVTYDEMSID